jgi:signal transduction histidine kinase
MFDPRNTPRLPARPPTVSPPPPASERRTAYRRADDRDAHEERVLLTRTLDVLAGEGDAEARLAGLLRLLARTAGAERAAVLADGIDRRSAVAIQPGEDPAEAEALAAWLDASSGRSRADRAASGPAPISLVVGEADDAEDFAELSAAGDVPAVASAGATGPWYALLPIPSASHVALGFEFRSNADADRLDSRMPPRLARHAAVALALVTEQLATERELASLRGQAAERSRFVSTVAHELRTPLTGLRGYLELILGGKVDDPEVERDFLERSRGIVGSMAELVGDLLELSRIESGAGSFDLEPFSLADACSRVAAGLMPIALERDIRLRTGLPPRLRSALGERRRVEQILTNLAGNGLKFTQPGGTVEIDGRFDGPIAIVVVRDDGPGIPAEDRSRIFERFHRLSEHDRIAGTGLGLPIASELAQLMGGALDVVSVPGSGSAFVLVLPGLAPVADDAVQSSLNQALTEEEVRLEERAVLKAMALAGRPRAIRDRAGKGTDGPASTRQATSPDRPDSGSLRRSVGGTRGRDIGS